MRMNQFFFCCISSQHYFFISHLPQALCDPFGLSAFPVNIRTCLNRYNKISCLLHSNHHTFLLSASSWLKCVEMGDSVYTPFIINLGVTGYSSIYARGPPPTACHTAPSIYYNHLSDIYILGHVL